MAMTANERQKRYHARRVAQIALMPKIPCACGCGELIPPINKKLKPATYKHNHHPGREGTQFKPGHKETPETKAKRIKRGEEHWATGKSKPAEWDAKRLATRRERYGDNYIGPEALERLRQRRGPASPVWKGGTSLLPYPSEFTRALKREIRERDGYTCQRCSTTQSEYGRTLHAHHIDADKFNNNRDNLVTLCGPCNTYFIRRVAESIAMFGRRAVA